MREPGRQTDHERGFIRRLPEGLPKNGFSRVKLYFMCGLPGEREEDLDGIIEMSEHIARLGKEVSGRFPTVVANVSNFVPKPQTPFNGTRCSGGSIFIWLTRVLRKIRRLKCVEIKCHDVETTMLRRRIVPGDRRVGEAIEWSSAAAAGSTPGGNILMPDGGSRPSPN